MAATKECEMDDEKGLGSAVAKKFKPSVNIGVHVDSFGPIAPGGDKKWRMEEQRRLEAEIKALQKELDGFNAEKAAAQVKLAIETKLKVKKLRLEEHKANLGGFGDY